MSSAKHTTTVILGIGCVLIASGIFLIGLWPFNFKPTNNVNWRGRDNGVIFHGQGIIHSSDFLKTSNAFQNGVASIELWIRPTTRANRSIARILSVHDNGNEQFLIGQWQSNLILQSNVSGQKDHVSYRRISIGNALSKDIARFITLTSGPNGTSVYLDGIPARTLPKPLTFAEKGRTSGQLILGNSATGDQYWTGDLLGLAFYDRVLTPDQIMRSYRSWTAKGIPYLSAQEGIVALYLFDEHSGTAARNHASDAGHLHIPAGFPILQKVILSAPWKDFRMRRAYFRDVAVNIAGFAPFGLLFAALLRNATSWSTRKTYYNTMILGAGTSLFIELAQAWLPTRSSSFTDLICNILGTILGIVILHLFHAIRQVRQIAR